MASPPVLPSRDPAHRAPVPSGPEAPTAPAAGGSAPPKRKRRIAWIISVILLSLTVIAAGVLLAFTLIELDEARDLIEEQNQLIDEKETFSAAMHELAATAGEFEGVMYNTIVPQDRLESLAARGWEHRRSVPAMVLNTNEARALTLELAELLATARDQAATNSSKTKYESVIDGLSSGFVTSLIDDADAICEDDVLGCVASNEPYVIHFDAADSKLPYMTNWLRTGLAYHEFAHVLQLTNPGPTAIALEAFDDDRETMADCYALTFLDGWTLDHTIWVSDFEYWEVSMGYGYTCNKAQKQVIRDWVEQVGYTSGPISQ